MRAHIFVLTQPRESDAISATHLRDHSRPPLVGEVRIDAVHVSQRGDGTRPEPPAELPANDVDPILVHARKRSAGVKLAPALADNAGELVVHEDNLRAPFTIGPARP